jgi:acyl-CoA thioester hydrolase
MIMEKAIYQAELKLRVRYGETDKMGYCYYGNYAQYFEVARVEALRELGLSYKELEDQGIALPVKDYSVEFKRPAKYDDELIIKTDVIPLQGLALPFAYTTYDLEGNLLNKARTTLVFVDLKTGQPMRVPEHIRTILSH